MIQLTSLQSKRELAENHNLDVKDVLKTAIEEKRAHNLNRLLYEFLNSEQFTPDLDYFEEMFPFFLNVGYEIGIKKVWNEILDELNDLDSTFRTKIDEEGYKRYFTLLSNHIYVERMRYRYEDYIPCRFGCTKLFMWPGIEPDLHKVIEYLSLFSDKLRTRDFSNLVENQVHYRYLITCGWFLLEVGRPRDAIYISELTIPFIELAALDKIPNIFEIEDIHITRYKSSLLWLEIMGYYQLGNNKMVQYSVDKMLEMACPKQVSSILNNRYLEASLILYKTIPTLENKKKVYAINNIVRHKPPHECSEAVRERLLVLFDYYRNIYKNEYS